MSIALRRISPEIPGSIEEDQVHFSKQIAPALEELFLNQILQPPWCAQALLTV